MSSEAALRFALEVAGHPGAARPRLELALEVAAGITMLSGPSGAGKSSCLLALAGIVRPARGEIVLAGRTLFSSERRVDLPPRTRRVGLLLQSLALFPHFTSAQNVAFGLPREVARAERAAHARRWLARMQVEHLSERRPHTLSGGEAQRVALARALASAPALLLLDEPFSALDPALRKELMAQVSEVVAELRIPALLVSHERDATDLSSTRIVRLREGRREP